jgi:hypothetical protein
MHAKNMVMLQEVVIYPLLALTAAVAVLALLKLQASEGNGRQMVVDLSPKSNLTINQPKKENLEKNFALECCHDGDACNRRRLLSAWKR